MKSSADKLTPRQLEVLERVANGEKRDSIAASLKIHRGTVDSHLMSIFHRLDAHSAPEALAKYFRLRQPKFNLF